MCIVPYTLDFLYTGYNQGFLNLSPPDTLPLYNLSYLPVEN